MKILRWDGQPISAPGTYSGIGMDAYHGDLCDGPSISSSGLRKIFSESPAHYFAESYLNPDREEQKDSEPLILGRGAHHLLLGESDFRNHFAIQPDTYPDSKTGDQKPWNNNATHCRNWHAEAKKQRLTVLTQAQIQAVRGMAGGLAAHPIVRAGILNGLIEHSIAWKDRETGIWLKVRPDAIPTDAADFADLKTQADISDDGIERAIGDRGYHMQGALIGMACREVLGRAMSSFTLVFAEKAKPHCVRVKTLKPADLELGEQQIRLALRLFARCIETGRWPGPGGEQSDAEYVEIKPWARQQIEHRMALLEQELAA